MRAVFLGWKDDEGNILPEDDDLYDEQDLKFGDVVEVEPYSSSSGLFHYRSVVDHNDLFRETELSFKIFEEVNLDDYL